MHELARYIQKNSEKPITLKVLSEQSHLSIHHLQRVFKEVIGVTPKQYLESCRLNNFKSKLQKESEVVNALYDSGYSSPSRVYEKSNTQLGMTPKDYSSKGKGLEISYISTKTILGPLVLAATDKGICFIQFGRPVKELIAELKTEFPLGKIQKASKIDQTELQAWTVALQDYLRGVKKKLKLPLDIQGTAFQIKVWKFLQTIPSGKTMSYSEVAQSLGQPQAFRAVANACAKNNIGILIPCHRVLRGDGSLSGYRWGVERKKKILEIEASKA